ncbi:MAG: ADP-ribosylglycohydrolase family protein [Bradymonadia bacterium]
MTSEHALVGCLMGTAVGDSVGLPAEGLKPRQIARRMPGPWRHRLLGPWGMCSDDTDHAFFVAQSLITSQGDVDAFRDRLAWALRGWFLALPPGLGLGTARACIKLCLGWPSRRAGVWSAGNGPAMRAPMIGAYFHDDAEARLAHVEASTWLTHTDPQALVGALAIAEVAAWSRLGSTEPVADLLTRLRALPNGDATWREAMDSVQHALAGELTVSNLADLLGLSEGITGYMHHTVPMVIYTVLRHREDPCEGLDQLWRCGGDTDTTGAIAGALFGVEHGPSIWPEAWLTPIKNGPLSLATLQRAGEALARGDDRRVRWWWPLVPVRNLAQLVVVLGHGFRRLVP